MHALPPPAISAPSEPRESTIVLRDGRGHKVGTIKRDDGVEKIYDKDGHYRGEYRLNDNVTRDREGHKIGTGDQNLKNLPDKP